MGGLHSPLDGQVDPRWAMAALRDDGLQRGLSVHRDAVSALEALPGMATGWRVHCRGGDRFDAGWVVVAAGLGSGALLENLGLHRPMEPVLGQAQELERPPERDGSAPGRWTWPGAVVWRGINLVPRPDRPGGQRFWLGATLEPGEMAAAEAVERMRNLEGAAPDWLQQARVHRHWLGRRARPVGRPAPLLEQPAPGLLLAGGHYRNGVLLAPASAAWVCGCIEGNDQNPSDR